MTPFSYIYKSFTNKISDSSLVKLTEDELNTLLETYLVNACTHFKICSSDLSKSNRDSVLKQFNTELTEEEIEIIASLMVVEWLKPQVLSGNLLKMSLGDKDFKTYSPANQLKELKDLKASEQAIADMLIVSYSYAKNIGDL